VVLSAPFRSHARELDHLLLSRDALPWLKPGSFAQLDMPLGHQA
jgi:hypothetical protein